MLNGIKNFGSIVFFASFMVLPLFSAAADAGDEEKRERPVTWALLSDNAYYKVPRIDTGATYTTDPSPDNPGDHPEKPRLQDGDRPHSDFNNTIGWSRRDGEIVFDLKDPYLITAADFRLKGDKNKRDIALSWRSDKSEEWRPGPEERVTEDALKDGDWFDLRLDKPVKARYVRAALKNPEGLNYLMEMRVWGMRPENSVENVHAPTGAPDTDGEASPLVQDGRATSAILVDANDSDDIVTAARDLQGVLRKMTGVHVPLLSDTADIDAMPAKALRIAVGPRMAGRFGIEVEQDYTGEDYYRLQTRKINSDKSPVLVIAGNDSGERRGTNYAVYGFLRRLGCGWYGPDDLWHVIPEREEVAIEPMNVEERADFGTDRNIRILTQFSGDKYRRLRDAWGNGGRRVKAAHSLGRTILPRKKYVDEHPEWFGSKQVNLTHPGAIEQTIKELRARLDKSDAERPVAIGLGALDSGGWADDERSREVGNLSAQWVYFLNRVARGLRETHPGEFQLVFYAYWFTHAPPKPMREAEPELIAMFVNEGNKARSWLDPLPDSYSRNNKREKKHFLGWQETGVEMTLYNWWIPGYGNDAWKKVPWYKGQAAIDNLRFWHEHGVRVLEYETMKRDEIGDGFPIRWPLFYVAARAFWDVDRDADDILKEACERLYEDAAPAMLDYYQTLEQALTTTKLQAGNWNLPSPEKIYPPEVRSEASSYLESALEKAPAGKPRERVEVEKGVWKEAVQVMEELEEKEEKTYELKVDGEGTSVDEPVVTVDFIRSQLGIPESTEIIVVEPDGQTREAQQDEEYDLRQGVEFKSKE